MYHGFDWYGRVLEVREVGSLHSAMTNMTLLTPFSIRTVSPGFLVQVPSEEAAFVEVSAVSAVDSEAVSEVEVDSEVDLLGMRRRVVEQGEISRIRISTRIIPALINRHRLHPLVRV